MQRIIVKNCSFGYPKKNILNNLNFTIPESSILAILGKNGRGKTTFLKCLSGIYKWNEGSVKSNTHDVSTLASQISYVPQVKQSPFNYSVLDFIQFGNHSGKFIHARKTVGNEVTVSNLLKELGMEKILERNIDTLSGGELQMVYIAHALISKPTLLLLDEPELNLDLPGQQRLLLILQELVRKGTTIIINSHFINTILNLADNVLFLGETNYLFGEVNNTITESTLKKYLDVDTQIVTVLKKNGKHCRQVVIQ